MVIDSGLLFCIFDAAGLRLLKTWYLLV